MSSTLTALTRRSLEALESFFRGWETVNYRLPSISTRGLPFRVGYRNPFIFNPKTFFSEKRNFRMPLVGLRNRARVIRAVDGETADARKGV